MSNHGPDEAIAIVGIACKLPQEASTVERFWQFLLQGRSAHTPWPEDRFGAGHYHPDNERVGTHSVKGAHFLAEPPEYFDAPFFGITKGEAICMDPQQRLVLENVYHALENAGIPLSEATGSNTSVYVSGFNHDYLSIINADPESPLRYRATGLTNSVLSNRVSWFFDFKGPSMTIDTACSSSVVTLHQACQSLLSGESDMAVSSGVTVLAYPNDVASMSYQGFLSQDGRCFSFDHRANGYARGEGVGTIIVKRLSDAIRDGNSIRAVIRGTGVNSDGRTPGLTNPDSLAQERLIRTVYARAGLSVDDTAMVEAHGTGTAAGDPIEANGIARAFSARPRNLPPLYIGACKSGLGHLEGAAGAAAIIKSVLVLENGIIPPNVNFEKVNPKIPAAKWRLQFPLEPTPWPTTGLRRMSINSFGVGGTNGHVVLDDAFHYLQERGLTATHYTRPLPPTNADLHLVNGDGFNITNGHVNGLTNNHPNGAGDGIAVHASNGEAVDSFANGIQPQPTNGLGNRRTIELAGDWRAFDPIECPPKLIPFSAFDEEGCSRAAKTHAEFLHARPESISNSESLTYLSDLAHTMSRRSKLAWRSHVLARSLVELETRLASPLPKPLRTRTTVNIGFVFTGQGAQWYGMGRELLCYPVFRESLAACRVYLQTECGCPWDLLDELAKDKEHSRLDQAALAQPACTALQVALVDLLQSWNIRPSRVVGHSSGEIAAAYSAGLLTRESAWRASYFRGLVTGRHTTETKGAMLAVGLGPEALAPYLDRIHAQLSGELVVACLNSPRSSTVSGDVHKVEALQQVLEADGLFARRLKVPNAYHSAHMQEFADEYVRLVGTLHAPSEPPQPPVVMISSVKGEAVEDRCLSIDYWTKNLLHPVRFSDALAGLCFSRTTQTQATLRADAAGANVFADVLIELGPHGALQGAIRDVLAAHAEGVAVAFLPALKRDAPGADVLLNAIGYLHARGYPINVDDVNSSADTTGGRGSRPLRILPELPGYQFNHSNKFWYESRLSRNYRLRKEIRHDLFGAPVPDWDAMAPRFRNVLRISEQPWLRDHIVTDNIILPGVGYVIAVIEAARQLADPNVQLSGFRLRDVNMKRALIVPDTKEGIEVMLNFKPVDESSVGTSAYWRRFQIVSYNPTANDWIEHCTGYVGVDHETSAPNPVDQGREARLDKERWHAAFTAAEEQCQSPWDFSKAYERMARIGLNFGPLFQNCSAVRGTFDHGGQTMGTVTVPDVASVMPKGMVSPHMMHPACMDSLMHFALAAIMDATGKSKLEVAMVPRFIKDIWISAALNPEPGHVYRAHSQTRKIAFEKFSTDVVVWDGPTQEPRISWSGIEASPLDSAAQSELGAEKLCHEIEWVPHVDMYLEGGDIASFAEMPKPDLDSEQAAIEIESRMQLASVLLVLDALEELDGKVPAAAQGHLCRYFEWMKHVESDLQLGKVIGIQAPEVERLKHDHAAKAELYKQVASDTAFGELAVRMGGNIVPVLRGETDPLQLMFGQDAILDRVYRRTATLNDLPAQQKAYLNVLAKNKANLRVLEVGAGTGSSTAQVLDGLAPIADDGVSIASSVSHYMYTDISAAFFEQARQKFQPYTNIMEYRVLDAEQDTAKQEGFEVGSYDLIVAQNVIHTTTDLTKTLSNIRRLLKPGGRLLLQEGIRQDYYWSGLSFGQLPGWWSGTESMRQWMPWVSSKQWNEVLEAAGFTGARFELPDSHNEQLHSQSLFVAQNASADANEPGPMWKNVVLVTLPGFEHSNTQSLLQDIKDKLNENLRFQNIRIVPLLELEGIEYSQSLCIVLAELERPVIADLSQAEYEGVRKMLIEAKGILWVTGDELFNPQYGAITGLMRTTRWERDLDDSNLVTLKISEPRPENTSLSASIRRLCEEQFSLTLPVANMNGEFMLQDGRIWTSRLREAIRADEHLQTTLYRSEAVPTLARDAGRPIKLTTTVPGLLEKLEWVTDETYNQPLSDTEVEIEIRAVGLNFRDLMIAMGEHTAYSMGSEAAGIISRVGSKVVDFAPGDRVVYICGLDHVGCMHTYGRLDQSTVAKVPDGLSLEMAAGLPVVYATVIYSLRETARLMAGETILIHAAAGGVGQAAIRYAQHIGAEVYVTLSTALKRDLIIREFGIPDDHIFSSRDLTFVQGVLRMTKGRGVDVVLNSLSGEALRRSWDLVAPFGRFIEIGKKDAMMNGKVDLRPYLRNVTMASVDLVSMMKNKPFLIKMLTEETMRLWKEGVALPASPTTIMPMSQVVDALRILQAGTGMGKIVLVPREDDVLPLLAPSPAPLGFSRDASYVLSGGLGGIGRSVAAWMASRGARNLIFLSSSGRITPAVTTMREALEADGCRVHIFTCDVSDKEQLRLVLEQCKTLPPIRGVVQGAMKLKDVMLENMSHEEFQLAVRPKIQGSWNLHELLPRDLEHFIMLSSATGVLGNRAQANYAAGNTFQDALAHFRRQQGLAATTIDVGAVLDVGYVADHADRLAMTKYLGSMMKVLREEELLTLIEYGMNAALQSPAQLVTGLTPLDKHRARGVPMLSYMNFPLFTQLRRLNTQQDGAGTAGGDGPDVEARLRAARTLDEAAQIVTESVIDKLSSLLSIAVEDVDPARTISANGVDSLVALELRTFMARKVKADVPVLEIMGSLSLAQLCRKVASTSKAVELPVA
ncbi:hypothetical protein V8C34DRAFT_280434 [Trichoderma compactum]